MGDAKTTSCYSSLRSTVLMAARCSGLPLRWRRLAPGGAGEGGGEGNCRQRGGGGGSGSGRGGRSGRGGSGRGRGGGRGHCEASGSSEGGCRGGESGCDGQVGAGGRAGAAADSLGGSDRGGCGSGSLGGAVSAATLRLLRWDHKASLSTHLVIVNCALGSASSGFLFSVPSPSRELDSLCDRCRRSV